jgi:hypothetical protein
MRCPLKKKNGRNIYLLGLGYGIDDEGFLPGKGKKFSVSKTFKTSLRSHMTSYSMKKRIFSLGLKRSGCEVEVSVLASFEVKNEWSYTSIPYASVAWKRRNLLSDEGNKIIYPLK